MLHKQLSSQIERPALKMKSDCMQILCCRFAQGGRNCPGSRLRRQFRCFHRRPQGGQSGHVIGVDITPDMIDKARRNADAFKSSTNLDNVEIRLGEIEHLPVADNSVDVVISNCVINLSRDKSQVWREITRVLRSGGRVAVSDLALLQPLPEAVRESMEALVGCIAGAVLVDETRDMI